MDNTINSGERQRKISHVTYVGSAVNVALVVFKFIAGVAGRSTAMVADAVHSMSDLLTDIIVIVFVRISEKPQDATHDYGHGKYETLATLLIGTTLLLVGFGIASGSIKGIISILHGNALPRPGLIALIGAFVSIVSKELLFRYTIRYGKMLNSEAVIANAWHHRSDAFSSVATAVGIGGAIILGDNWTILDPLAGLFICVFIIKTAYGLIKPALDELLEKSLPAEVEDEIAKIACGVEGVSNIHDMKTRKIGDYYSIEFSICMDGDIKLRYAHAVISEIEKRLRDRYGDHTYILIHEEPTTV